MAAMDDPAAAQPPALHPLPRAADASPPPAAALPLADPVRHPSPSGSGTTARATSPPSLRRDPVGFLRHAWRHEQHRNAILLIVNMAVQAAAGLLFWLLLTRALGLDAATVGLGYSVIALGTTAAVLAKGGLDTALLRHAPIASRRDADALLRFAIAVGAGLALLFCAVLAALGVWPQLAWGDWLLAACIAVLLVATWLQDALFLAEGQTRNGTLRNLAAAAIRILLPLALFAFAAPRLIPLAWALALGAATAFGFALGARLPRREGTKVARRAFLASAGRNVAGGAAEFLPGLLLAPLVLATQGATAAAHFGMAWTIASLLFLASAAISRSALARLVTHPTAVPDCLRRATRQHLALAVPAAIVLILLSPHLLAIFGPDYPAAAPALAVLALSLLAVAPAYLYLALLRARETTRPLVAFPLAMVAALAALAPALGSAYGLFGVAVAWLAANLPFGLWAAHRLHREAQSMPRLHAQEVAIHA